MAARLNFRMPGTVVPRINERGCAVREHLPELERAMLAAEQVECPVTHHFSPGVYTRQCDMPAGAIVLGQTHREVHQCVLLKGRLRLLEEDGTLRDVSAPAIFLGKPGRKFFKVLEDATLLNVYAATETDPQAIEDRVIEKTQTYLDWEAARKALD